jgi:hypothetical protein
MVGPVRLLVFSPEMRSLDQVTCFTDLWAFNLTREFERLGVELRFEPLREDAGAIGWLSTMPLDDVDHVLALGLRYWQRLPEVCGRIMMKRTRGAVTQYSDGPISECPCDCTFMTCEGSVGTRKRHFVGWGVDTDICYPRQAPGRLGILVDHVDYGGAIDLTMQTMRDLSYFIGTGLWENRFDEVRIRRLVDGGAEDCATNRTAVPAFTRQHVPFQKIAIEYGLAHIFLPTHAESVGLTVLEAAASGALIVAPRGFIRPDRLRTVRHIEHDGKIPWQKVMANIDVNASRKLARQQTWGNVAARMLDWFKAFRK